MSGPSSGRRVVVTGMGIACPLGLGVEHVWSRLIAGHSGIKAIQSFDTKDLPAKIGGQVPAGTRFPFVNKKKPHCGPMY